MPHGSISAGVVIPSAGYFTICELVQDAICIFVWGSRSIRADDEPENVPDMPMKPPANRPPRRLNAAQAAKRAVDYAMRAAKGRELPRQPEPVSPQGVGS